MRCKISDNEWLDLALIRRIQFESQPPVAIITWFDGSTQVYNSDQATTIISAWTQLNAPADDDSLNLMTWREKKEREIIQILRRRGGKMSLIDLLEFSDVPYSELVNLQTAGHLFLEREMAVLARPDSVSA